MPTLNREAGVFGKVNNGEEVTSVLANAMDGASASWAGWRTWDFTIENGDFMVFNGDFMVFNGDFMVFNGDFMVIYST